MECRHLNLDRMGHNYFELEIRQQWYWIRLDVYFRSDVLLQMSEARVIIIFIAFPVIIWLESPSLIMLQNTLQNRNNSPRTVI